MRYLQGRNFMSVIDIEIKGLDDEVKRITSIMQHMPEKINLACVRATNRTLESLRAETSRIVREEYTAKASVFKKRTKLIRAVKSKAGRLEIKDGRGIGLINFAPSVAKPLSWKGIAPKNRKKTVTNKIKRSGSRKVYNDKGSPFVATVEGKNHIFVRNEENKLERLFGPSSVFALTKAGNQERLEMSDKETFVKRLKHEVTFILEKNK